MGSVYALIFALWCGLLLNTNVSSSRPYSPEPIGASVPLQSTGEAMVWKAYLEGLGYLKEAGGVEGVGLRGVKSEVSSSHPIDILPTTGPIEPPAAVLERRCGMSDQPIAGGVADSPNRDGPYETPSRERRTVHPMFVGPKWNKTLITYNIRKYSRDMTPYEAYQQIEAAFQAWQQHIPVNFEQRINYDADIDIEFATWYHHCDRRFDGRGKAAAHAFYPPNPAVPTPSWDTVAGDIHFDEDETWSTNNSTGGIHLYDVALHEIGHSLGIGHSEEQTSIMWPYAPNPLNYGFLSEGDIAAVQSAYGVRHP